MAAGGSRTVKIRFTGETADLTRAAKTAERDLKKFGDGADTVLSGFGKSIVSTLSNSGVYGAAAILAAVVATAPLIGAALTAGILLAFGGGALALGIMAALKDPKVAAAFQPLKDTAKKVADSFGQPFKGPLVRAAATFNDALKKMQPTLNEIGRIIAPIIDELAPAFADMAKNTLPGVKSAVEGSTPFFQILADMAPKFGKAISEFLENVTKGGPGAQQFLKDMLNFLIWVLPKVGSFIGWLSNQYTTHREAVRVTVEALKKAWEGFKKAFAATKNWIGDAIDWIKEKYNSFKDKVVSVWDKITSKIESAVKKIKGWWQDLKDLASSAINFSVGGFDIPGFGGGRAVGGPVMGGKSYLVGERGPEILTMGGNGHVTPNHELGGGGPQFIELTVDLGQGIRQVFQGEIKQHDRDTKRRATARMAMA